jgi:hypothetical protein
MQTYIWTDIRDEAIALCNETPYADTEERILAIFQRTPALVVAEMEAVGGAYRRGGLRSFWAVLASRVEERAARGAGVEVNGANERDVTVRRAHQWLRNVGMHFDCWPEVEDELFGERGMLRHWADESDLRDEIKAGWTRLGPAGEKVEAEAEERARAWITAQQQALLKRMP